MRNEQQNEKVLDTQRSTRTNNQKFIDINIDQKIYKYMLTEPINYLKHLIPPEFENHTDVLTSKKLNEAKEKKFQLDK